MAIGEHNKKEILKTNLNVQKQPLEVFNKKSVLKWFAIFLISQNSSWSTF